MISTMGAQIGQAENIVQLVVGQEPSVRRDPAAMEFQLQAAVKIDPKAPPVSIHPSDTPWYDR